MLRGIVHAFSLQRLLIPGTDPEHYLSGVRALITASAPRTARGAIAGGAAATLLKSTAVGQVQSCHRREVCGLRRSFVES